MDASIFNVQPAASEPIYRQIVAQLERLIVGGQLAAGEALPSVREVAKYHAVNPMTVSRAYSLAESEGLLERQRGKGMVVAAKAATASTAKERLRLLEPLLRDLARQADELELPAKTVLERLQQLLGRRHQ